MLKANLEESMKKMLETVEIDLETARHPLNPDGSSKIPPLPGEHMNGEMSKLVASLKANEDKNLSSVGPTYIKTLDETTREVACRLRETAIEMREEATRRDAMADALDKAAVAELTRTRDLLKQIEESQNTVNSVYRPWSEDVLKPRT